MNRVLSVAAAAAIFLIAAGGQLILFAADSVVPSSIQGAPQGDPAVEQIAFFEHVECSGGGGIPGNNPACGVVAVMDADGTHVIRLSGGGEPGLPGLAPGLAWSPDGLKLLAMLGGDIFLQGATGDAFVNLTNDAAYDDTPAWSPDGAKIAFASGRDGQLALYLMNPDGSGVRRLNTGTSLATKPTWSPDSRRLAFTCVVGLEVTSDSDICAIDIDGSGFSQLTTQPGPDIDPAYSPDGQQILFVRSGKLATMRPDGSDVADLGTQPVEVPSSPAWSSDGTRIAFTAHDEAGEAFAYVCLANADGTNSQCISRAHNPSWRPWTGGINNRPVPSFTADCRDVTCTFDASASLDFDGTITTYTWYVDGRVVSGQTVTHTFTPGGVYNVTLVVMDNGGAIAASSQPLDLNQAPAASFTIACVSVTCTFDGSASSDPDGTIASFRWSFGDESSSSGARVTHTYVGAGTYTVTLNVYDNANEIDSTTQSVVVLDTRPVPRFALACTQLTCALDASASSDPNGTIVRYAWNFGDGSTGLGVTASHTYGPVSLGTYAVGLTVTDNSGETNSTSLVVRDMHIGDLDGGMAAQQNTWSAVVRILAHTFDHSTVAGAAVVGLWSDQVDGSCTTSAIGECTVSRSLIPKRTSRLTFTVHSVTHATGIYRPPKNHDPDVDSDGTSITLRRP